MLLPVGRNKVIKTTQIETSDLNLSELLQLCKRAHIKGVHRGVPRETLEWLLEHWREEPTHEHVNRIDRMRNQIQIFFCKFWDVIQSQVTCHTCCSDHSDAQVVECFIENEKELSKP